MTHVLAFPDLTAPGEDRRALPALAKIVATLGPASSDPQTVGRLIDAGVRIVRMNFSHGSFDEHAERLATVRRVADEMDRAVAVLGDLPGPKIRVGKVAAGGVPLATGATVVLQRESIEARVPDPGEPARFSSTWEGLVRCVEPGDRVLVADGTIRMLAVDRGADFVECTVTHGGTVTSGKGINLPDSELDIETVTERDRACAAFAVEHGLDLLAMSFVRHAGDVRRLQEVLAEAGATPEHRPPIVAKIELPRAVREIHGILETADGIMVARGDLGVEVELAHVPIIQKELIRAARAHGRPVIVATQMLESMIEAPSPTRAEATDVANAILDGADATMLSGETAVGRFPVLTVEHMRMITRRAEDWLADQPQKSWAPSLAREEGEPMAALAHGVWTICRDVRARCVVIWSEGGGGATHLSRNAFRVPIVAVTSSARVARKMQLLRGVIPKRLDAPPNVGAFIAQMDEILRRSSFAAPGDRYVIVAGEPLGRPGVTNSIAIHEVPRG